MSYIIAKPDYYLFMVGTNREQIRDTAARIIREEKGSGLVVPKDEQMMECIRLEIICGQASVREEKKYTAHILDNVVLNIFPEAAHSIIKAAQSYQAKRGDSLYHFDPIRSWQGRKLEWYLPKEIMDAVKNADWSKFQRRMSRQRGATARTDMEADSI